jgi:hypothetical protein
MPALPRLESSLFDWLAWRSGSPLEVFGFSGRGGDLLRRARFLRPFAIGWCEAERVPCRPKRGCVAVMFQVAGRQFWFHLSASEFAAMRRSL